MELNRSAIHFADYNPRKLSDESRKTLKRGIKKFGLVGGIVVNKRTGLTVVSGHQRLSVMDELQKFPDNDYRIRVDVIDVDEQQEKELNILMNNPNAQGTWDFDIYLPIFHFSEPLLPATHHISHIDLCPKKALFSLVLLSLEERYQQ